MPQITQATWSSLGRYVTALGVVFLSIVFGSLISFGGHVLYLYIAGYQEFGTPEFGLLFARIPLERQAYLILDGMAAGIAAVFLASSAATYRGQFARALISATVILLAFDLAPVRIHMMREFLLDLIVDLVVAVLISSLAPLAASYLRTLFTEIAAPPRLKPVQAERHPGPEPALLTLGAIVVLCFAGISIVAPSSPIRAGAQWVIVSLASVDALFKIIDFIRRKE